ncbi:MAG: winged helix-turn-helix domain-containing protein [archaeon]|nr:winged helix-turn-helix domain-containing protein [archaeon]
MDYFEQTIYWLLAGSKGALNRLKIISDLEKKPMNMNELSKKTGLNYTTIQHHIDLLLENNLLVERGSKYGKVLFISSQLIEKNSLVKKLFDESVLHGEKNEQK